MSTTFKVCLGAAIGVGAGLVFIWLITELGNAIVRMTQ